MITVYEYNSLIKGPTLLIFGAIHGNEICGSQAIKKISQKFENGQLSLKCGRLILVPVANPTAFANNKRYIEEDLNRIFSPTNKPKTYEQQLANVLCPLIDKADVFLDIHSTSAPGQPTIFLDFPTKNNYKLAQATGLKLAIVGWPKLYQKTPKLISLDTTAYVHSLGKDGILIECGQHQSQRAPLVAEKIIIKLLKHLNLIESSEKKHYSQALKLIKMSDLFIKNDSGDSLIKKWKHLEPIKKGQIIGRKASGELIISKKNQLMILPKYNPLIGKEWFYLGSYK